MKWMGVWPALPGCQQHKKLYAPLPLLQYLANFTATFGYVPLREHQLTWDGRKPPYFCEISAIGCVYL